MADSMGLAGRRMWLKKAGLRSSDPGAPAWIRERGFHFRRRNGGGMHRQGSFELRVDRASMASCEAQREVGGIELGEAREVVDGLDREELWRLQS
ncbi:hypothetical protein TRIUR3_09579 [Triticum urartu]|uniref:Uncharacterized protein n=1 Tax=Triticum urartu TaxID=4572 RepID=M7ZVX1_TRIUA|nr:hypothetical protein TRIUR3_09579 [Triticum urartu]